MLASSYCVTLYARWEHNQVSHKYAFTQHEPDTIRHALHWGRHFYFTLNVDGKLLPLRAAIR